MSSGNLWTVGASGRDFTSIQEAIDSSSVQDGDTIYVYAGEYTESALYNDNPEKPTGLYIDKELTIRGVDDSGNVITDTDDIVATVTAADQSPAMTSFYVVAENVTISGLKFVAAAPEDDSPSKGFEVSKNNFTLENSIVTGPADAEGWWAGPVYFHDATSEITTYKIDGNILYGAVMITNGTGYEHDPSDLDMQVTNNTFYDVARDDDVPGPWGIYSNGIHDGLSYYNVPSVMPTTVSGNSFPDSAARYLVETDQDPSNIGMDRAYVEAFIADNSIAQYAYGVDSEGDLITSIVDWYGEDISYRSLEDRPSAVVAASGDTIITSMAGKTIDDTISTDGLTIDVLEGGILNLTLDTGVITLALAGDGVANVTGNATANTITGNDAANTLSGEGGNDTLSGAGGNDTLDGGTGNDALDGGDGVDTAVYDVALGLADIQLDGSGWKVSGGTEGVDTLAGIEIVSFVGGRFLLVGHGGFATTEEAIAAATLPGDVIIDSTIDLTADQQLDMSSSTASVYAVTGSGNDTIFTGIGDDTIVSGAGDDYVKSGDGNDNVDTGDGNDTIIGGTGNGDDVYNGGLMMDTVVYSSATSSIVVNLKPKILTGKPVSGADGPGGQPDTFGEMLEAAGYSPSTAVGHAQGADIGTDALLYIENVIGGSGNDTIKGDSGSNILYGADGNDDLHGKTGNDELYGGNGKDKIKAGHGNDLLYGGNGADKLIGSKGKDTLVGGAGKDKLKGQSGKDTFLFNDIGKADKVQDFKPGKDKLAFDGDVFTALGSDGKLDSKYFGYGNQAKTADQKLIYQKSTGTLWYDADGNKKGFDAVKVAVLKHDPDLSAHDIFVM